MVKGNAGTTPGVVAIRSVKALSTAAAWLKAKLEDRWMATVHESWAICFHVCQVVTCNYDVVQRIIMSGSHAAGVMLLLRRLAFG
jgi:hypothetical protein